MVDLSNRDGPSGADNALGPYESWLFELGKHFDLPAVQLSAETALSCVAEFAQAVAPTTILTTGRTIQNRPDLDKLGTRIPTLWRDGTYTTRFLPFIMQARLDGSNITLLDHAKDDVRNLLVQFRTGDDQVLPQTGGFRINLPIRGDTIDPAYPAEQAAAPVTTAIGADQPLVIMGIIDHGIPLAHRRLRGPGGLTRVDYAWAQAAPARATDGGQVLYGREIRGDEMNALIAAKGEDEDAIYRSLGLLSQPGGTLMPLDRGSSHGAHVADLMCGGWPADTAAQVRVIAVDLPGASVWETAGFGKDMFLLSALHYIFERADRIAAAHGRQDVPVIVNLSYGHSCGPQDGTGLIEAALEELVAARRQNAVTELVMPSGNMRQDRLLARLTDAQLVPDDAGGKRASLHWFVPPNDRTSTYLELWLPVDLRPDQVTIRLFPPGPSPTGGQAANTSDLGKQDMGLVEANILWRNRIVGQFSFDRYRNGRWRAMVILCPTELPNPDLVLAAPFQNVAAAPAGLWTIEVGVAAGISLPEVQADGYPGGIHCRIQRDQNFGQGRTGARQSRFVDAAYQPRNALGGIARDDGTGAPPAIRRLGTLNGMATAASTTVVAGHVAASGSIALYSGAPPADAPASARPAVQWTAPSDRAPWFPGLTAAGTRSGQWARAQGTSSAAPQVARALAMAQVGNLASAALAMDVQAVGNDGVSPV